MKINYNEAHITLPEDNTEPLSIEFTGAKYKVWEGDKMSFDHVNDTWEIVYSIAEVLVKHNGNTIIQSVVNTLPGLSALFGDA